MLCGECEILWQRTKQAVLDHFIAFGEQHLRRILAAWLEYFHRYRPHRGIGNVLLEERDCLPPLMTETGPSGEIVRYESLGGLLKHYQRKAA